MFIQANIFSLAKYEISKLASLYKLETQGMFISMNSSEVFLSNLTCYTVVAWRIILTDSQLDIIAASIALLILPVIATNTFLCIALYKTRQLQGCSKILIFGLSISDCFCGIVVMPAVVTMLTVYGHKRVCWLERLAMILGQSNGHFSLYILLSLALQRLVKAKPSTVHSSFLYRLFWTKSGLTIIFITCSALALLHGLVSVYFFGFVTSNIPNIVMLITRVLITVSIYIVYFYLYFSIKRYVARSVGFLDTKSTSGGNATGRRQQLAYNVFFKTVALIMIVFVVCYLPLIVTDALTGYYTLLKRTATPRQLRFLYYLFHSIFFMNSVINAAIFIHRDQNIRLYLKSFFNQASETDIATLSRRIRVIHTQK